MKTRGLLALCCLIVLMLLAACQGTTNLQSDIEKDGAQLAGLANGVASGRSAVLGDTGDVMANQEGTATPTATPMDAGTWTSTPTAVTSPLTFAPGSCTVQTEENRTVYMGPGSGYSIIGRLELRRDYLVTGMYYRDDFPTWWRIGYDGKEGWVSSLGAITNFMPGASCTPAVQLVEVSPAPAAPQACTVHSPVARTMYSGPGIDYQILGQIEPQHNYLVTGMYYATNYPTWWRIDYDGTVGWIDSLENYTNFMPGASCNPPVELIDVNSPLPAVTPTPAPTSEPTPAWIPGACYVAPTGNLGENRNVYAGPDFAHPVIGTLGVWEYVRATGQLPYDPPVLTGARPSIRVDFYGREGWVTASTYAFSPPDGGCWPIPVAENWPTPPAGVTPPTWTPAPTATLHPDTDQVFEVQGEIGTIAQFSRVLPDASGATTQDVTVLVDGIPPGQWYPVTIQVQCEGTHPEWMRWNPRYLGPEKSCGDTYETTFAQYFNHLDLILAIPADGMTAVYYTITVTVNAP